MATNNASSSGSGGATLLTIAFVVLKLCKVINWSWWWVLSPIWITAGIAVIVLGGMGIYYWRKSAKSKKRLNEVRRKYSPTKTKWEQRVEQMHKNHHDN